MWEELCEELWPKLERFCSRLCRDSARAEDLTQETFLRALQNTELLQRLNKAQLKAWLFSTARNLYCDQVRRAVKEEQLLASLLPADGEEHEASDEFSNVELDSLLALVSPDDRALLKLRYKDGYNATELGRMFNLPPATVRTRLAKARALLKNDLTEEKS